MIDLETIDGVERVGFFLGVLRSLREFDRLEVEGVTSSLLKINLKEECFLTLYLRAQRNVDTLLSLQHVAHFQAVMMLSRAVFELCVDTELFERTPGAEVLMLAYKDLELLRAARTICSQSDDQTGTTDKERMSIRKDYVVNRGSTIETVAKGLWPNRKLSDVKHWSGTDLSKRAQKLGGDTFTLYSYSYRQFSWFVHSGLQGTFAAPPEQFPRLCGLGYSLAAMSYKRLLLSVARTLHLTKHDDAFEKKLEFANVLPQSESQEDERQMRRDLDLRT